MAYDGRHVCRGISSSRSEPEAPLSQYHNQQPNIMDVDNF